MIFPTPSPTWSLDPQLTRDTIEIGDLPLSRVLVVNDANWPWLLLVPRRLGASEIIDLDEVEQAQLMTEIARVARAMQTVTGCDKLNIAALGNVVSQLHVHVIARREGDAGWPRPIWGAAPALPHDPGVLDQLIAALRGKIWITVTLRRSPRHAKRRCPRRSRLMSPRPDLGPKPRLGYAESLIDRAAERRGDAAALAALENGADARVYVIGGELVPLNKTPAGLDPLFTFAQARALGGSAEVVFLGLMDGAARFALALDPATIEALKTREDLVVTDLRSIAVRGPHRRRPSAADRRGQGAAQLACAPPLLLELRRRRPTWSRAAGGATARPAGSSTSRAPIRSSSCFRSRASVACSAARIASWPACGPAWPASSSRARRSRTPCAARSARRPGSYAGGSPISGRSRGRFPPR